MARIMAEADSRQISVHDNTIVGYSVDWPRREISLDTVFERPDGSIERTCVVFVDVEAYFFQNDCPHSVIFDVVEDSAERIVAQNLERLKESFRMTGWPRFGSESADEVHGFLRSNQIRGFWLEASIGMSGWVLAREMRKVAIESATDGDESTGTA